MLSRRAWLRATSVEQVVSLPGREKHMLDLHHVVDALRAAYDTWGYPIVLIGALLENTALLGLILPGGSLVLLGAVYAQQVSWPCPWCSCWAGWAWSSAPAWTTPSGAGPCVPPWATHG